MPAGNSEPSIAARFRAGIPPGIGLALYLFAVGMIATVISITFVEPIVETVGRARLAVAQDDGIPVRVVITGVTRVPRTIEFVPGLGSGPSRRFVTPEHWLVGFDILGPDGVPGTGEGRLRRTVAVGDLLPATFVPGTSGGRDHVLFGPVQAPGAVDWLLATLWGGLATVLLPASAWLLWRLLDPLKPLSRERCRAWAAQLRPGVDAPLPVAVAVIVLVGGLFGFLGIQLWLLAIGLLGEQAALLLG